MFMNVHGVHAVNVNIMNIITALERCRNKRRMTGHFMLP